MQRLTEKKSLTVLLISILIVIFIWYAIDFIVTDRTEALVSTIEVQLAEQQALMISIAETTARNGADGVTEQIVRDCAVAERTRFDDLLGRLDQGLGRDELVELERLFGRCGSFFAERKLVMSSRLEREFALYQEYLAQHAAITATDSSEAYNVTAWQRLIEQEQRLSEEFAKLVDKQDSIITTLLTGKTRESDEIQTILREVKDIQDGLIILNTQVSATRAEVSNL